MGFLLAYLYFTLPHSKGQGQGHAYFDNEYLENGNRQDEIITLIKYEVMNRHISISIFPFDLAPF